MLVLRKPWATAFRPAGYVPLRELASGDDVSERRVSADVDADYHEGDQVFFAVTENQRYLHGNAVATRRLHGNL